MKRRFQKGQATIELCVMLIALAALIIGISVLNGFFRANQKVLLEARYKAQQQAAQGASDGAAAGNGEILDWNYPQFSMGGSAGGSSRRSGTTQAKLLNGFVLYQDREQLQQGTSIPFALGSLKTTTEDGSVNVLDYSGNSIGRTAEELDAASASSYDGEWETYSTWRKLSDFNPGFEGDYSAVLASGNAYGAADLTQGRADGLKTMNAYKILYPSFRRWFGTDPKKLDVNGNPGNCVYMPRLGSE